MFYQIDSPSKGRYLGASSHICVNLCTGVKISIAKLTSVIGLTAPISNSLYITLESNKVILRSFSSLWVCVIGAGFWQLDNGYREHDSWKRCSRARSLSTDSLSKHSVSDGSPVVESQLNTSHRVTSAQKLNRGLFLSQGLSSWRSMDNELVSMRSCMSRGRVLQTRSWGGTKRWTIIGMKMKGLCQISMERVHFDTTATTRHTNKNPLTHIPSIFKSEVSTTYFLTTFTSNSTISHDSLQYVPSSFSSRKVQRKTFLIYKNIQLN